MLQLLRYNFEFISPFPLEECIALLRTIGTEKHNFDSPPSARILSHGCSQDGRTAECRLIRLLFTGKNGISASATVKLSATENAATQVQGNAILSRFELAIALYGALGVIALVALLISTLCLWVGILLVIPIGYLLMVFWNRQALVKTIYKTLAK